MKAYIDDSYDDKDGVYVLAGCIASLENWSALENEWKKLLPNWGTLSSKSNEYHFKMNDMNHDYRRKRVPVFLSTIEKYITGFIYAKINTHELKHAQSRIQVDGVLLEWQEYDAFYFTFRALLDKFHLERQKLIEFLGEEKIDFVFDMQAQKDRVYAMWNNYLKNRPPEVRKYYGEMPKFEDDQKVIQLQSADLIAGWIRSMYLSGTPEKILKLDFEGFSAQKKENF